MTKSGISRRHALGLLGSGAAGLFLNSCGIHSLSPGDRPFTVIALPDTQCYTDYSDKFVKFATEKWGRADFKQYFFDQTQWIRDNKKKLNIKMAVHLGDIVNNNVDAEWVIADQAFRTLDGEVPYILNLGNHDMDEGHKSLFCKYFPKSRFASAEWYGGHYGDAYGGDGNYFTTFESVGGKYLVMSLEFKPRREVLAWANDVFASHPKHRCMITTHCFLSQDASRNTMKNYKHVGTTAQEMWDISFSQHKNIFLVLSGHILGSARRTDPGEKGNPVHQVLSDYQGWKNGGEGYLRIMTFHPSENRIDVKTYSPSLDNYITSDVEQFSLPYVMG